MEGHRWPVGGWRAVSGESAWPVRCAAFAIARQREAALLEMGLWVRDGATTWQTLVAATRNAAELCRVGDQLGTVEAGKLADLIVVAANPLDDINNLRQLQLVIKNGRVVSDKREGTVR